MTSVQPGPVPATEDTTTLGRLVGDTQRFFETHWAKEPLLRKSAANFVGLITEREIWDELDCGLLSRPYFTVFNEGVRSALGEITQTREVVGHQVAGYADPEQIRKDYSAGATFKLNQVEHWHPRIRSLVLGLEPHFCGGLEAFVFLSPPGKTAMQAHTDGAHVFILQVMGRKDWVYGRLSERSHSDSTLHEGEIETDLRVEVTLEPGDVMYLPHGCPHFATARDGNSIHVAVTVEEPTAVDLANVYLAEFLGSPSFDSISTAHHRVAPSDKVAALRAALRVHFRDIDPAAALSLAMKLRRTHL